MKGKKTAEFVPFDLSMSAELDFQFQVKSLKSVWQNYFGYRTFGLSMNSVM